MLLGHLSTCFILLTCFVMWRVGGRCSRLIQTNMLAITIQNHKDVPCWLRSIEELKLWAPGRSVSSWKTQLGESLAGSSCEQGQPHTVTLGLKAGEDRGAQPALAGQRGGREWAV